MKKNSVQSESLFEIRHARARLSRIRRREYLYFKKTGRHTKKSSVVSKGGVEGGNNTLKKISVPQVLSLTRNQEDTLAFLHYASLPSLKNRKQRRKPATKPTAYFDFVNLKEISPAAALVLCSMYDVFQRRGGDFKVFDYDDWQPSVKETFAQVGFFKWLDFKGLPSSYDHSGELSIQAFASEKRHVASKPVLYLKTLVSAFNSSRALKSESTIEDTASRRVASSILEAVENSVRHAYHNGTPKDIRGRWWVGGVSYPASGEVMVACYDCGTSIPASIQESTSPDPKGVRKHVRKVIQRYLRTATNQEVDNELDHKRLKLALRYLYTTSGVEGGGKGLSHIASTIDECEDGSVEIFTRRAYFCAKKGHKDRYKLLPAAMPGTLIIWRMRLYAHPN